MLNKIMYTQGVAVPTAVTVVLSFKKKKKFKNTNRKLL